MSDKPYTEFIARALEDSKPFALDYFAKITSHEDPEKNIQIMQDADAELGTRLVAAIQSSYPGYNVLEEHAGALDGGNTLTWTVKAIHGRDNFANALPHFGVMIGLLDATGPLAGGILLPIFDELYVAERWKGATCNGKRLVASGETELSRALMSYVIDGHPDDTGFTDREMPIIRDIILHTGNLRTSNSVFDAMQVARGSYGAIMNQTARIWDTVPQHIMLVESGCIYTDFWGRPADYSKPLTKLTESYSYCAAPAALHTNLQALIQAYAATRR
jgi:myo-inositol-1(or 4)-monophosphatase